jgi:hypothetical protein
MQIKWTLIAAMVLGNLSSAQAQDFTFGLWGDMPYARNNDAPKMQAVLDSINASDIKFSLYDGDIKDGSSKCTDDIYSNAITMFNSLKKPVVYIPGDNEWTDCHRTNNGGYNNLERLDYIRKTMFAAPTSYGQEKLKLTMQGAAGQKFAENTRFDYGNIVFVGLNVPGSNNNFVLDDKDCKNKSARTSADCEAGNAEYLERDAANIEWLKASFSAAKTSAAKGLVIAFQADPGFDLPETEEEDESKQAKFKGYQKFIEAVVAETEKFAGQVLLVHGDTHFFKVDMPLYSPTKLLPNLTRVQTFGSPSNHWVHVTVDSKRPEIFTVRPVMVKQK